MSRLSLLLPAILLVGIPLAPAAEPGQAGSTAPAPRLAAPPPEPIDVLYLSDARPVVVRFQITAENKPLAANWEKFVTALLTKLDADKNGLIDGKELGKLSLTLAMLTGRTGFPTPDGGTRRAMTREELAEYLRRNDLGVLRLPAPPAPMQTRQRIVRAGSVTSNEDLDKAFMELLDTDKDGKLSAAELAAAPAILAKLDADENEMLTTDEILRRPGPLPFFIQEDVVPQPPGVELAAMSRKSSDPTLAKRLLTRYGPKPPAAVAAAPGRVPPPPVAAGQPQPTKRRLTQKELGLSQEVFDALDQDGDGELDTEELARFGSSAAPEVEILLRLGQLPAGTKAIEVIAAGKPPVNAFTMGQGTEAALEVPGVRLDLNAATGAPPGGRGGFRAGYQNRFRRIDRDQNGYIDATESGFDPLFRELFPLLDRDGDGKVFEKELLAAIDEVEDLNTEANRGILSADVAEASRGLFGLIDTDGDNRLSVRELRAMPKLIERFDRDKDGYLSPGEVPRRFRLSLTRGLPGPGAGFGPVFAVPLANGRGTPRPTTGPLWFQKMDRNKDGDVSRREFLGTDEEFRRIDTDGDGLIDVREAEAATPQTEAPRTPEAPATRKPG